MDQQLSKKLKNLSFLLMVLVAFIHGYNINIRLGGAGNHEISYWLQFLENFITDGICRVAVPMFFAISGYLACYKINGNFTWKWYKDLQIRKFYSLVIPYLAVSFLGIALVVILQLIPFSKPFFNNYSTEKTSFGQWIFVWLVSPVPFQLWFIRFLWQYFLLFPFFFFGVKYFKVLFIVGLAFLWGYHPLHATLHLSKIEIEGAFFFALGTFISIHGINLNYKISKTSFWLMAISWCFWVAFRTQLLLEIPKDHNAIHYNIIGITIFGFFVFWFAYDLIARYIEPNKWFIANAGFSFGVFLFHEPCLTIIKKIAIKSMGVNDLSLLLAYLITPLIAFLLALYFSRFLANYSKQLYGFLTGNRIPS